MGFINHDTGVVGDTAKNAREQMIKNGVVIMPKPSIIEVENTTDDEHVICPACGGRRFQVHERGELVRSGADLTVFYDELAVQCQTCHHVHTIPITGVLGYEG